VYQYWSHRGKLDNLQVLSAYTRFRKLLPYRYLQALSYVAMVLFFVIICLIVDLTANRVKKGDQSVSECLGSLGYIIAAQGIIYILAILFFLYHLWKAKEAFSIRPELMALVVTCVPVYILFGVVFMLPNSIPTLRINWLLMIVLFISLSVTIVFPLAVALRTRLWRNQRTVPVLRKENSQMINELLGTDEFFSVCIDNSALLESFKDFTVESWCVESILFYSDVLRYEKAQEEERKGMTQEFLKEYVLANAPLEINIDHSTREKLKAAIERGDSSNELFEEAKKVVYSQLRYDVFPKWLRTSGFRSAYEKSGLKRSDRVSTAHSLGEKKRREKAQSIDGEINTFGKKANLAKKMSKTQEADDEKEQLALSEV